MDVIAGVGSTTDRSVRLWLRCERPGPFTLELEPAEDGAHGQRLAFDHAGDAASDWCMSIEVPGEVAGARPLTPHTRYRYRIGGAGGEELAAGSFVTAPASADDTPERFTFAVMSCHQPYTAEGELHEDAARMLRLLGPALERHDARYLLLVGDQMYADHPPERSLFDEEHFRTLARHGERSILECGEEEILHHYHRRYRAAWGVPEFARLQRDRPTYWMLDDHEIVDNWGSSPEHLDEPWQRLARAARRAFRHYQAAHQQPVAGELPASFHHAFRYGTCATFVTDMRSQRRTEDGSSQVLGPAQMADLERFLADSGDAHVVFVVLTVPIMHLPEGLTDLGVTLLGRGTDLADRWEWSPNTGDRDRLLTLLREHQREHPRQRMVLLCGDIHIGCALRLQWDEGDLPPIIQLVSSAVTNVLERVPRLAAKLAARLLPRVELEGHTLEASFVRPVGDGQKNPFAGLNVGLVEVVRHGDTSRVRFRLLTHGDGDEAVIAYDSGEL